MGCFIIGIAGGTGSGKSTFASRIEKYFCDKVTVVHQDNYYKSHDDISFDNRKKLNYDHPDAVDFDLLIEHIKNLKNGVSIHMPIYDFKVHSRGGKTVLAKSNKIILLEGILIFQNPFLRDLIDLKIFIDVDADIRVLRRAKRDIIERGRTLDESITQYLSSVRTMHNLFVEPSKVFADVVVTDSFNDKAFDLVKTKVDHFCNQTSEEQ